MAWAALDILGFMILITRIPRIHFYLCGSRSAWMTNIICTAWSKVQVSKHLPCDGKFYQIRRRTLREVLVLIFPMPADFIVRTPERASSHFFIKLLIGALI